MAALIAVGPAFASTQTADSLNSIQTMIQQGRYQAALRELAARKDTPNTTAADCFLATILHNRVERYSDALASAEECKRQRHYHPRLYFESAWAAYKLENLALARENIRLFQQRAPDNSQGERLYILLFSPDIDDLGKEELEPIDQGIAVSTPPRDEIRTWVGSYFGFNDNVMGLPDGYALPSRFDDKQAFFLGLRGNTRYTRKLNPSDKLYFSYQISARFYDELNEFNSQYHRLTATYDRRISEKLASRVEAEFNNYLLGGNQYRHQYRAQGELFYRSHRRSRTILSARVEREDFKSTPPIDSLRRDANGWEMSATQEKSFTSSRIALTGAYGDHRSDGREYDHNYWQAGGSYTYWFKKIRTLNLSGRPTAKLSIEYRDEDYDDPSVFRPGSDSKQRDVLGFGIYMGLPLREDLNIYAAYRHTTASSDVRVFDYAQNNVSFGINSRF